MFCLSTESYIECKTYLQQFLGVIFGSAASGFSEGKQNFNFAAKMRKNIHMWNCSSAYLRKDRMPITIRPLQQEKHSDLLVEFPKQTTPFYW